MQIDIVQEYSFTDLQQKLEKHGYVLGKTQLYEYLKQSQVDRVSPGFYSLDAFDRVLCFAQLMLRYRNTKTAKTKFHQHYPHKEEFNDDQQNEPDKERFCKDRGQQNDTHRVAATGTPTATGWAGI